jgi:hypothetical protein
MFDSCPRRQVRSEPRGSERHTHHPIWTRVTSGYPGTCCFSPMQIVWKGEVVLYLEGMLLERVWGGPCDCQIRPD